MDEKEVSRRKRNERKNKANRELRMELIRVYGGKCQCPGCDCNEPSFLSIDHVLNDGAAHRRRVHGAGYKIYRDLRKMGYPKKNYRLLCFNCNMARNMYGICPHEKKFRIKEAIKEINEGSKDVTNPT